MNKYESVIIINANLEENVIKGAIDKVADLIKSFAKENATELTIEDLGRRKMAYEVRGCKEGRYIIYNFYSNPENIRELERVYRITEEIIKFIVVRKDD